MNTTKNQQITGLVLGGVSVVLTYVASAIANLDSDGAIGIAITVIAMCLASLICGIIGIVKSAGAKKAAKEANEKSVIALIGLIVSIVGTVYAAIIFCAIGLVLACAACVLGAAMAG